MFVAEETAEPRTARSVVNGFQYKYLSQSLLTTSLLCRLPQPGDNTGFFAFSGKWAYPSNL